jgi:hypothetical protein
MNEKKQYCLKLVQYGKFFEWFEFEIPLVFSDKRKVVTRKASNEEITENTVNRAKSRIRALCLCNPSMNKFVTMTFSKIYDYKTQVYCFKSYVRRLKTLFKYPLKYVCVPEYGAKKGRFHFHYLSNQPYIPKSVIEENWREGFCHVEYIDDPLRASSYVCKYMSKDFGKKVINRKLYFASRTLDQPVVYRDDDALFLRENLDLRLSKEERYSHPFLGVIKKLTYFTP